MLTNADLRTVVLDAKKTFLDGVHRSLPDWREMSEEGNFVLPLTLEEQEMIAVYDDWYNVIVSLRNYFTPDEGMATLDALFAYSEQVLARTNLHDAENKAAYIMTVTLAPHVGVTLP